MSAQYEQLKIARRLNGNRGRRPAEGLYDPAYEHDACGVGFVANIKGRKSHDLVMKGLEVLANLEHRGACGCDPDTGDGAGLMIQMPDRFLRNAAREIQAQPPVRAGNFCAIMKRATRPTMMSEKEVWPTLTAQVIPRNTVVPASDDRNWGGSR